ncbi:neural Wiskott-Aldrich syndrome protein isoform X2 [Siniperca chuatsi]|uniref:neural Wiskott-Aldrich syndrome protein isoform X2 n=1 Tax=Siniperca chuatsi TaxID=119488 RepID=UPI001CE09261|nr:neural Wiskott-Aldrich syndrome protein isoform X2 [Siniperca chuatsi]
MASSVIPGCHVMSDLLTIREKGVLFTLLEPQCKHAKLLWEEELYIPFKYNATRTFFHTFPADGQQVGLNFANETEAEEFHLAVEAVQRNQEEMTRMIEITKAEGEDSSTSDPHHSGIEPLDHFDGEPHFPMDAPSTTVTPATSSDQDPAMRRLLMQARLTKEDLRDKDIAEAVDCIINRFGGLKAVQRELWNIGPASQTLPRSAGASISLALKKGPLPPVPSIKRSNTSQRTPQGADTLGQSQIPPWIPPPPTPAPVVPERFRKSASFKHVGSSTAADRGDLILTALTEVFRQKQLLQQTTSADGSESEPDSDVHL